MPPIRSLELLEDLLSGEVLTPAGLDDLLQNHPDENQHLDFKDGLETQNPRKASTTVRQYVTAFANATGGILIVGVDEPPRVDGKRPARSVSPCTRPGGQALDEWATRVLNDLAPYFSPPPRMQVVAHGGGEILVIATARAPRLVPIVESGQLAYYVRLHDSTLRAHDWLISDLVLGRRNHPLLVATRAVYDIEPVRGPRDHPVVRLRCEVLVENVGLPLGEDLRVGVVAVAPFAEELKVKVPTPSLLSYVGFPGSDPVMFGARFGPYHALSAKRDAVVNLRPFEQQRFFLELLAPADSLFAVPPPTAPLEDRAGRGRGLLIAALYVTAKDMPPRWYQLSVAYKPAVVPPKILWSRLEARDGQRPEAAWRSLPPAWEEDPNRHLDPGECAASAREW